MARTTFADLGYRVERIRLNLPEKVWEELRHESELQAMPLGWVVGSLLRLALAVREEDEPLTHQLNRDLEKRISSRPVSAP